MRELSPVASRSTSILQDCDATVQREAAARTARRGAARQSLHVLGAPVRNPGWRQVPTTYLVCAQDGGAPARRQREFAQRADAVVDVDSGHHPFPSQPGLVRELVLGLQGLSRRPRPATGGVGTCETGPQASRSSSRSSSGT